MLWIGGQISSGAIVKSLFIPSVVCLMVPLVYLTFRLKGSIEDFEKHPEKSTEVKAGKTMSAVGICSLIYVPVFKTITHFPPFLGILLR